MGAERTVDVLLVSLGTTPGWRINDASLAQAVAASGYSITVAHWSRTRGGYLRGLASPIMDLAEAATAAYARLTERPRPRAIIYSTTTAALLQPPESVPTALWFDDTLTGMRLGSRNAPLRLLERSRQRRHTLLMPMSLEHGSTIAAPLHPRAIVALPPPVHVRSEADGPSSSAERYGVVYGGNPWKKGLELAARAWTRTSGVGPLYVTGISREAADAFFGEVGMLRPESVIPIGALKPSAHRALVREASVYLSTGRREEFGVAQMEAIGEGTPVVMAPSAGRPEAAALLQRICPQLLATASTPEAVADAIARAQALTQDELLRYGRSARHAVSGYSEVAFQARVANEVLPQLLA